MRGIVISFVNSCVAATVFCLSVRNQYL